MIIKDTYYKILGIEENATKEEIKIKFRSLSLKYHPDKYSGDPDKYLEIKEAYETLHNDETRKVYNLKLFFKGLDFNDEDYELLNKYYNNIINSQEYKLMKLLYESIPKRVKLDLWNRFKGYNKSKQIVKAQKSIDITNLYDDLFINLCISKEDYINNVLKVIFIISNNGIYYIYLRRFDDKIVVDNISCYLTINFYIIN
jgi:curved DNA-binding protein CbpA